MLGFLRENGFTVSDDPVFCDDIETVCDEIDKAEESRPHLDFLIDGMVVKVRDFATRGGTGRHGEVSPLGDGVQVCRGGDYHYRQGYNLEGGPHGESLRPEQALIRLSLPARQYATQRSITSTIYGAKGSA